MTELRTDNPYANQADPMLIPLRNPYIDVRQAEKIKQAWNKKYAPPAPPEQPKPEGKE